MIKRRQIQLLLKAGLPQAEVARIAGIAPGTVRQVQAEPGVEEADDEARRNRRRIGRPSKVEPFRKRVEELLAEEPELMSLEILRRVRLEGYTGGKTALYDLVAAMRPSVARPMVRLEGLPGEFTQHDFGQADVRFLSGTKRRVSFFASRLEYSRWVQVSIVEGEQAESLVRTLLTHFEAMGGVPLVAVFARHKTVALEWNEAREVTKWIATFTGVMLELGVGVEVCWPGRGKHKASAGNLVSWVKRSFFEQLRFLDDEDLSRRLAQWHTEVNEKRPSRATGAIPADWLREELPRLRPLKITPEALALKVLVFVGLTATVLHDTHEYSMPPEAIGMVGTLYLYRDRVRIVAGRFEARHPRLLEKGARSTLPEHRAEIVEAVSGRRARRYLKSERLLELGPPAFEYLTEVVHRRPRAWVSEVDGLHALLEEHGPELLRAAFVHALEQETCGTEHVARYLGELSAAAK